ncbi:MAG: hypothetical protein HY298_20975 [Verrucomicrobia bacterium]|nr:hypothetical protein [Verrucomicrobiota bacterium]
MTGGKPDRVPCTPDFSNMIPCRLTGKPFWDIYLNNNPAPWRAYLEAAKYFGIDAWFFNGTLDFQYNDQVCVASERIVSRTDDFIVQRTELSTPAGMVTGETTYCRADPPTQTLKYIKDIAADFAKFRYLLREPTGYTTETAKLQKAAVGKEYAFGTYVVYPGFQAWMDYTEGGVQPVVFAEMDHPELLEELRELHEHVVLRQVEMILDSKLYDYILLAGSGSVTLASPKLFDKYAFPTIQKITSLCKQAGVPTMLHSCGKQTHIVKRCAEDSDLNCINPLEIPPMGDCDLAKIKRLYGEKIALMGNLHTTEVMLFGTPTEVERAAKKCIDDAAAGGGFILSTGDQCGRDTPDLNIRKLVEVCETYGRY